MLTKDDFYTAANVKQHDEFLSFMKEILFDKPKREEFYLKLLDIDWRLDDDHFKRYFEEYLADRKGFKQDFTPRSVAKIACANITPSDRMFLDPTAGTGTMLIEVWDKSRKMQHPFFYNPAEFWFEAGELDNTAVVFLIHNMAIRGMNGVVVHGDALSREVKQIYFIQNAKNNPIAFSSVNVVPHSEQAAKYLNVKKWTEDEINYIEDEWREEYANWIIQRT